MTPEIGQAIAPSEGAGEDRVAVEQLAGGVLLAVADGAGGMGGGAAAAENALLVVCGALRTALPSSSAELVSLLGHADAALDAAGLGQCALVVAVVLHDGRILGASVGDCGAWLIGSAIVDLTAAQVTKPLLGSGEAWPMPFEAVLDNSTLLLASDGLLKYARRAQIAATARGGELQAAAHALVELPRLRSGELPDDVAVVLCRAPGILS